MPDREHTPITIALSPTQVDGERGIVELANDLGMSPSTAHRYAHTLVEVGLLERCPKTRKYRLPAV